MNINISNQNRSGKKDTNDAEQGFMLVGLIVAIFLILLALSVAAPTVAKDLRREREVEAIHRGNQYVRAIRLYYKKTGMYPGSIEVLEKSNNIRYLRQRYIDPITGKADWRLIHVGEAKTTVKGFFGQPLAGLTAGLGSAAGMVSPGPGGAASSPAGSSSTSTFGSSGTSAFGSSSGTSSFGSSSGTSSFGSSSSSGSAFGSSGTSAFGSSSPGASGSTSSSTNGSQTNTLGSASGMASTQSGTGMPTGGAPFVGVGVPKEGESITVLNEQTTYNTWEFLYDPRIEQLYAKGSLLGGAGSGGLGSASSMSSGTNGTSSVFGNTPTTSGLNPTPSTSTPTTPPQQ